MSTSLDIIDYCTRTHKHTVILVLRLCALYGNSKKIITFTVFVFCVCVVAGATTIYFDIQNEYGMILCITSSFSLISCLCLKYIVVPIRSLLELRGCIPFGYWSLSWISFVPIAVIETTLASLAILKGYKQLSSQPTCRWSRNSLMDIIIQDSLLYYLA